MVRKIFSFLYQETDKLHQAAFLLAFFSILSTLLAFMRDRFLAHSFGASTALDIYYAAFRIPDFIFVTIASVVSISIIVPFIVERESKGREAVREFVDDIFTFFSLFIVTVCATAFVFMPFFSSILFKGFSGEELSQVILLSRIFLLSPIFLGISNLLGSLTQAYNRFLIYAFAPVIYNLSIIAGVLLLAPKYGVAGVAWGVVIGSLLHAVIQIPFVIKIGLLPRFRSLDFGPIKRVVSLSFPRTLTLSFNHIAVIFLVSLASLMTAGSISIYTFSFNISSVPLSIIGVSYSLAAFPTLSRHFSTNNMKAFVEHMSTTIRHIAFWALPITALFIIIRAQLVRVLLGSGQFDWNDIRLTAAALALFSLSILAQSLLLLFIRAFYSAGYTRKPLLINLISTIVLIACAYVLVKTYYAHPGFGSIVNTLLRVGDVPGTVVLMIPLGHSIGTILNAVVHWIGFENNFGRFGKEVYRSVAISFLASLVIGAAAYGGLHLLAPVFDAEHLLEVFLHGLSAGVLGIIAGVITLWLLGSTELKDLIRNLHQKFWKAEAVAENSEIV